MSLLRALGHLTASFLFMVQGRIQFSSTLEISHLQRNKYQITAYDESEAPENISVCTQDVGVREAQRNEQIPRVPKFRLQCHL